MYLEHLEVLELYLLRPGRLEHLERLVLRLIRFHLLFQLHPERLEHPVFLANLVLLGIPVIPELQQFPEHLVVLVLRLNRFHLLFQWHPVHLEHPVFLEPPGLPELPALLVVQ